MQKTLGELIQELEELAEQVGNDTIVMIAHQPSWPLQENVDRPILLSEAIREAAGDEDEDPEEDGDFTEVVYLVATGHEYGMSPYAPRSVFTS